MILRISVSSDGPINIVSVEGSLKATGVRDLQRECRSIGSPLRLDLSGLLSVDEVAIEAIRKLQAQGAEIVDPSPYIEQMLGEKES